MALFQAPLVHQGFKPVMERIVFSAVDALKSKSSIVAMKVASLPSHSMWVTTLLFSRSVLIFKSTGVLKLSGETASATALAVFWSSYSSVTVASKLLTLQLTSNHLVSCFDERIKLIQGHLCTCSNIVPTTFTTV